MHTPISETLVQTVAQYCSRSVIAKVPYLVAVHENAQDTDLVDQGLDGSPAANAEAEDEVVGHQQAVEEQDRVPASSPAAMRKGQTISFSVRLHALVVWRSQPHCCEESSLPEG